MKNCPYCANEIQDAAVKCQHCNEFLGTVPATKPSVNPNPVDAQEVRQVRKDANILLILETGAAVIALGGLSLVEFSNGSTASGIAFGCAAFASLFLCPIAWKIGDGLRRFAMPSAYFTTGGFVGLIKARLFWMVGPQTVSVAIVVALLFAGCASLANHGSTTQNATSTQVATTADNTMAPPSTSPAGTEVGQSTEASANPTLASNQAGGDSAEPGSSSAAATQVATPSFNCEGATGSIDKMICANPELASEDRQLSDLYKQVMAEAQGSDADRIKNDQRTWLNDERNGCEDANCLASAYSHRISFLKNDLAAVSQSEQ